MVRHTEQPAGGALHNMSAPPRTRIEVRPLRRGEAPEHKSPSPAPPGAESGMTLLATVSLAHLIRRYFPPYRDVGADGQNPVWEAPDSPGEGTAPCTNLRLCALVALSEQALNESEPPDPRALHRLAKLSVEDLEAAWLAHVRRLRPGDHRLPPFGLVQPVDPARLEEIALETSPARAAIIVSRSGGPLYSPGRAPGLPDYTRPLRPLRLYGFTDRGYSHD
jgi:hypothetical protein